MDMLQELLERELESGVEAAVHAVKATTNPGRPEPKGDILNHRVKLESGDANEGVEEGEMAVYDTRKKIDMRGIHLRVSNRGQHDSGDVKREGFEEGQMVFVTERAEDSVVAGYSFEHKYETSVSEVDKVRKGGYNTYERVELQSSGYASVVPKHHHQITPEVSNKAEHQQSDHAGRREQTVKVVHRVEHETADVKRKRADAGEAVAAAKRTRGVTGVEGHSSDRKVKSQGHGERPYIEAVTTKGSSGPVEDGELPSSNQDLGILFSPARLEKRAHASLVGRERVTSSPGNQRGHYQSTGDQTREGHRDSRHAAHARDQLHHHHASSNSAHRHSQQQRPDVDSDRRSYAHREQGDPDHRKGRHEHGN
jgi:hypothetical protein